MLNGILNFMKKILNIKNKEEKEEIPYTPYIVTPYIVIPDLTPPNQILTTDVMTYDKNEITEELYDLLSFDARSSVFIKHIIKHNQDDINSIIFSTDFSELVKIFTQLGQKPTKVKTFDKGVIARLKLSWVISVGENDDLLQHVHNITIDIIGHKTKQIGDFFRSFKETAGNLSKLSNKIKIMLLDTMNNIYHNERCVKLSADNQSYIVEHLPFFKNISLKIYPTEIINDNESNEKDTYSINTFELSNNKNKDRFPIICKILKKN